jgi:hypothetical protein
MKIKESFNKLKKPIEWVHYALNTLFIIPVFYYLMNSNIITESSTWYIYAFWFFIILVISDRLVHGILGYD